ncbi:30S ribosomal protein S18 [endosymbiont GvMRE of Glomus versiforme]|nr:30S ribosomal protein S18 [endosymbiont GvMRE of Glomus versiforme]
MEKELEVIEEKIGPENLSENKEKTQLEEDKSKSYKKTSPKPKKIKKVSMRIVKKNNYFTRNNITYIDYKDIKLLSHFINKQGQIIPKTFVKLPSKIQRIVAKSIKRARQMKLMPYIIVNQGEF